MTAVLIVAQGTAGAVGSGVWFGIFFLVTAFTATVASIVKRDAWIEMDAGWRASTCFMLGLCLLLMAMLLAKGCRELKEEANTNKGDPNAAAPIPERCAILLGDADGNALVAEARRNPPTIEEHKNRSDKAEQKSYNRECLHMPNVKDEPRRRLARGVRQHDS